MQIYRDVHVLAGFRYEAPLARLPELKHCGEALCSSEHQLPPHAHSGFEFYYLTHGAEHWQTGSDVFLLEAGDLFIAPPGVSHHTAPLRHPAAHTLWLCADLAKLGPAARALARRLLRANPPVRRLRGVFTAEPLMRGVVRQVVEQGPGCEDVCRAYLETLALLVRQQLDRQAGGGSLPCRSFPVAAALRLMEKNLDQAVPLADLARAVGLGPSQFSLVFRREMGVSPVAHHLRLRLDAARDALSQPAMKITQVALEYGFSSSQHFSAAFRKQFGITPVELRGKRRTTSPSAGR